MHHRYYTILHAYIDKKHTMILYDVAHDIAYTYLGRRLRRVALAMPLERPQVLPHDPRPSLMYVCVLHRHSPDALSSSLSLACAIANVSGDSLVLAK